MKVRGGQLLARALQEKGVTQVFTLSGGFCNPALEGFVDCDRVSANRVDSRFTSMISPSEPRSGTCCGRRARDST